MINFRQKIDNSTEQRSYNKLRKQIAEARARWEKTIQENLITKRTAQGGSERSPQKILYIARSGGWFDELKNEVSALQAKIKRAGYTGAMKPRAIWLPTIIENPKKITLVTYQAISNRKITLSQARASAKKAGLNKRLSDKKIYTKKSTTGINYKLRSTDGIHKVYHGFSEWALCICHDEKSLPQLKKAHGKPSLNEKLRKGSLCSTERSALFIRKKPSK